MRPWQMILAKVNSVRSELPSGIEDPTISSSTGGSGIMYISFRSDKLDASQVTDYIQRVVKPQFFTVEGWRVCRSLVHLSTHFVFG